MSYSIKIKASAARALGKIPRNERRRVLEVIDRLALELHAGGVLKGELAGLRRVRVGSYRVIYEVQAGELVILVVRVAHRKNAYR